jgi:capsular polysaccharide transport system permease protein
MSAQQHRKRSSFAIQRTVVFALFVREIKARLGGRWGGAVWVVVEPLAHIAVLMAMFATIRHILSPGIDYPIFLLTGLMPYIIFRSLAFRLMEGIEANRSLYAYRQVKPMDALVSRALLEVVLQSAVYLLALALMAWLGLDVLPARPLELIGVSAVIIALGFSLGLFLAVSTHGAPRARVFIRICSGPLYLLSGVIMSVNSLPTDWRQYLLWNPGLHLVELSRSCFFRQYRPLPEISATYLLALTTVFLALGMSLYRVRRQQFVTIGS